jgi:hypothetical protein
MFQLNILQNLGCDLFLEYSLRFSIIIVVDFFIKIFENYYIFLLLYILLLNTLKYNL